MLLKWAGSKMGERSVILPEVSRRLALNPDRSLYIEPFIGAGWIAFSIQHPRMVINDLLPELGILYRAVQLMPLDVHDALMSFRKAGITEADYLKMRATPESSLTEVEQAARMIYLNRLGFNGLWRTNGKGENNVPFGKHENPKLPSKADFMRVHYALKGTRVLTGSYLRAASMARPGDVTFWDPPYLGTFQGYSGDKGNAVEPADVRGHLRALVQRGVHVIATLPEHDEYERLGECMHRVDISRPSPISSGAIRGPLKQTMWLSPMP